MVSLLLAAQLGLTVITVSAPPPTPLPSELTELPRGGCSYTQTGVYCSNSNLLDGYLKANCTWQGGGEFLCAQPRTQLCRAPSDPYTGIASLDCTPF